MQCLNRLRLARRSRTLPVVAHWALAPTARLAPLVLVQPHKAPSSVEGTPFQESGPAYKEEMIEKSEFNDVLKVTRQETHNNAAR